MYSIEDPTIIEYKQEAVLRGTEDTYCLSCLSYSRLPLSLLRTWEPAVLRQWVEFSLQRALHVFLIVCRNRGVRSTFGSSFILPLVVLGCNVSTTWKAIFFSAATFCPRFCVFPFLILFFSFIYERDKVIARGHDVMALPTSYGKVASPKCNNLRMPPHCLQNFVWVKHFRTLRWEILRGNSFRGRV